MLEKIDLSKNMTKKEVKPLMEKLDMTLSKLQREARELKIPVMILFEGWGAAGKGTLINRLIQPMDPRGFKVFTSSTASLGVMFIFQFPAIIFFLAIVFFSLCLF